MNRDQGLAIVCAAVAECLCLDPHEVKPGSRLISDLAASSLDLVDLMFTLEERFGVKISDAELNTLLRGEFVPDAAQSELCLHRGAPEGREQAQFLPAGAVDRLAAFLPGLAEVPDRDRLTPPQIIPLITVESLWLLVARRLP